MSSEIVFSVALGVMIGIRASELMGKFDFWLKTKLNPEKYQYVNFPYNGPKSGEIKEYVYMEFVYSNVHTVDVLKDFCAPIIFEILPKSLVSCKYDKITFTDITCEQHCYDAKDVILYDVDNNVLDVPLKKSSPVK